jgi:sulfur-oxidizing protein SoxY
MQQSSLKTPSPTRRRVLVLAVAGGAAAAASAMFARMAAAGPKEAAAFLAQIGKGTPKDGRIAIKAQEIAENGNTVPLTITVESPMTEKDYVKTVRVAADGNPNPGIVTMHFTPAVGRCEVQIRCRLAQTEKVIAVAEMSDGSLWTTAREIKVTIGGCGG